MLLYTRFGIKIAVGPNMANSWKGWKNENGNFRQASAYKQVIYPGLNRQLHQCRKFCLIYFIGVDEQGEGFTPDFFLSSKAE
jgi:hypothetical protein